MTQEALRMAHKALIGLSIKHGEMTDEGMDAITAIKEALAKEKTLQALHSENERLGLYKEAYAEQEPVAWVSEDVCEGQYIDGRPRKIWWECSKGVGTAFYTHPQRTWVGLTDVEMEATFIKCGGKWNGDFWKIEDADFHPFLRTIEAKLKEKNT